MPISLPPISRRRFIVAALAVGAGGAAARAWADGAAGALVDGDRFALFSDTHVAADLTHVTSGVNMADHLRRACDDLLRLAPRPAALIVNGDCAWKTGEAADYAAFLDLLEPARGAGFPLHLTLGNHDRRDKFWEAAPPDDARQKGVADDRHTLLLKSPRADWFILDSLDATNQTPGLLGEKQLAWLAGALDAGGDKPAVVMTHHHPPGAGAKVPGLTDAKALLDVLLPRKRVKAYLFGHTHDWGVSRQEGLHLVNLPPVSYVFAAGKPSGWVDARLAADGAAFELRCVDPQHPRQGEKVMLKWR